MNDLFALLILVSLVLFVIGLFKPSSSLFWDKKKRTRKKSALVYGGLTILFFILFGATTGSKVGTFTDKEQKTTTSSTKNEDPSNSKNSAISPSAAINDHEASEKTKEQLKRELASFEKPFDNSSYQGTIEAVQMELVLFGAYANIIEEGKDSPDGENKKLADQLQKKVTERQLKEFPVLRKRYAKVAAEKLWENDIYVTTSGSNNTIINLTAGLFAANKNIAETQKTLVDILTQFRFKEVRYRWYKGADEFTYYKLDVPKDSEPVDFK